MSGYRHSGMSQEDYEARELLREATTLIKGRWPGEHLNVIAELDSLIKKIEEES